MYHDKSVYSAKNKPFLLKLIYNLFLKPKDSCRSSFIAGLITGGHHEDGLKCLSTIVMTINYFKPSMSFVADVWLTLGNFGWLWVIPYIIYE